MESDRGIDQGIDKAVAHGSGGGVGTTGSGLGDDDHILVGWQCDHVGRIGNGVGRVGGEPLVPCEGEPWAGATVGRGIDLTVIGAGIAGGIIFSGCGGSGVDDIVSDIGVQHGVGYAEQVIVFGDHVVPTGGKCGVDGSHMIGTDGVGAGDGSIEPEESIVSGIAADRSGYFAVDQGQGAIGLVIVGSGR